MQDPEEALECLGNGIPPRLDIRDFGLGHELFLGYVGRKLDRIAQGKEKSLAKFVVGPRGSGKTTVLRLIEQEAIDRNFAVAYLSADSRTGVFRDRETFVRAVFANLRTTTKDNGDWKGVLERFSDKVIKEVKKDGLPSSSIDRVVAIRMKIESALRHYHFDVPSIKNALVAFTDSRLKLTRRFKGAYDVQDTALGEMDAILKFFTEGRVPGSILRSSFIEVDLEESTAFPILQSAMPILVETGHAGLVVLVDEMWQITTQWAKTQVVHSLELAQALYDQAFERTFIAFGATDDMMRGFGRTVQELSPSLMRRLSDGAPGAELLANPYGGQYILPELSLDELRILFQRVHDTCLGGMIGTGNLPSDPPWDYFESITKERNSMYAGEFIKAALHRYHEISLGKLSTPDGHPRAG